MISENRKNEIRLFCLSCVSHMFAKFQNKDNRGANFSWESFPKIMGDICASTLGTQIVLPQRNKQEYEDFAGDTAEIMAFHLVKDME